MSHAIISKTRKDYNLIAKHFSDTRAHPWAEFEYFKKFIKDSQNILDWGCGNGRLLYCLKNKKAKYFGVDQSSELLKIARKNFKEQIKSGQAKFFCVPGGLKKFPNNFFDTVFIISSLFHLPTEESRLKILKNIFVQMKTGAKIIIEVWNLESDWAKIKIKKGWAKIGDNDFLIPWKDPTGKKICDRYYHHFTPVELEMLCQRAGYTVQNVGFIGNGGTWTDNKGGKNLILVATKKAP